MIANNLYYKCGPLYLAICLISSIAPPVWSQSTNLDAHVHGEAELLIAIEDKRVEMQLLSPASNILGFEHEPASDEQWEQVHQTEELLKDADRLFDFGEASCVANSQIVELPFEQMHGYEEQHAHEAHEEDHKEHEAHAEVSAHYVFECAEPPTEITALLITQFPLIESLNAQWITELTQGAQELNANRLRIDLR